MLQTNTAHDYIPDDEEALKILNARAENLAQLTVTKKQNQDVIPFVKFKLNANEYYGISFDYIKEVIHKPSIAPLPCSESFISGVINWRGKLIAIINLKGFLGMTSTEELNKEGYIIIIHSESKCIGLLIDDIKESDSYEVHALDQECFGENSPVGKYILGLHQGNTAIINIDALMSELEKRSKIQ